MIIQDEDWLKAFGTDTSQIEKPVTTGKQKPNRAQHEAELIKSKPELFDATKQKPRTTLFE